MTDKSPLKHSTFSDKSVSPSGLNIALILRITVLSILLFITIIQLFIMFSYKRNINEATLTYQETKEEIAKIDGKIEIVQQDIANTN